MLKIDSLRAALTQANTWCQANPEAFTVFVEEGGVETTGETPTFVYRYSLVVFVMNYPGSLDDFTLPIMAWLWFNEPSLLLNPDKNRELKFTTRSRLPSSRFNSALITEPPLLAAVCPICRQHQLRSICML